MNEPPTCPVCGGSPSVVHTFQVLTDQPASVCRCTDCGFQFVAEPHWLPDTFASHLHTMDVGSVDRSLLVAQFILGLTSTARSRRRWRVLDIGGGDGLVVRLLRDRGVDARFSDPYTTPIYDVGPAAVPTDHFELGVMSEVALHLTDPVESFRAVLERCDRLLFTAVVPPDPIPADWWYLMPTTGQHVAFYPVSSIERIARELGCHWCSDGRFFHLISRQPIPRTLRVLTTRRELTLLLAWVGQMGDLVARARGRQRSLTAADQRRVEHELTSRGRG